MKRALLPLLFLAASFTAMAQHYVPTTQDSIYPHIGFLPQHKADIRIEGLASSQSTAIPSALSNRFVDPGFIDADLKQAAYDRLNATNRFGAELEYGLGAVFYSDSLSQLRQQAWTVRLGTHSMYSALFGEDALRLTFSGNDAYTGQTARMDDTRFQSLSWQYLEFGYRKAFENAGFGVYLSGLKGNNYSSLNLDSASLYTDSAGYFLDLQFKGNYFSASRTANRWNQGPSAGAALGFDVWYRPVGARRWLWEFQASDFGFMQWNAASTSLQRDTSLQFNGVYLYDVLNFNDSTYVIGDTLLQYLGGIDEQASAMKWMPFRLRAATSFDLNRSKGERLMLSVDYRNLPGFRPRVQLHYQRRIQTNWVLGAWTSYGGWGGYNTGLRIQYQNKKHGISLVIPALEGYLNAARWSGNGLGIAYQFAL